MKLVSKETKTVKSAFNDEFENYLKKQQVKTTFNGSEVESFSWYRKALGLGWLGLAFLIFIRYIRERYKQNS